MESTESEKLSTQMLSLAKEARAAARVVATATTQQKNDALHYATEALIKERSAIEAANSEDLAAGKAKGLAAPMLDRLKLDSRTIERLAERLQPAMHLPGPL